MIASGQPPVDEMVRVIVDEVRPRRVVLFGSRARGDARADSDVDLMVELDAESDVQRQRVLAEMFLGGAWSVDIKVVSADQFAMLRDDPGSTVYDAVREGRLLYRRDDVPPTLAGSVRERPKSPATLAGWLAKAAEDLRVVELLLQAADVPWSSVCFHAQQTAEKYLKALAIQSWRRPRRTHDLVGLLRDCRGLGYRMPELDDDCALLSKYAVTPRYADDRFSAGAPPSPSPLDGQAAVAACRRIVAATRVYFR